MSSTKTKDQKSKPRVASTKQAELVFVVDVTSLTKKGYVGSTEYEGNQLDLEFDDGSAGITLTSEMSQRLHVRKGSGLSISIETERNEVVSSTVAGIAKLVRISDPKVYYAVGREGGAVIRVRKA